MIKHKELSPKRDPLKGDNNYDLAASRESTYRSTFEELRVSTSSDMQAHPNFFELHPIPMTTKYQQQTQHKPTKTTVVTKSVARALSPALERLFD